MQQQSGMQKSAFILIPVANGTEEMEAVILIDILRRAGAKVIVASVEKDVVVTGANQIKIQADMLLTDLVKIVDNKIQLLQKQDKFDYILLPGGEKGAKKLSETKELIQLLREQKDSKKYLGAICHSVTSVLGQHELLKGNKITTYPCGQQQNIKDCNIVKDKFVSDGNVITTQGPGTTAEMAIHIVKEIFGKEHAQNIADKMVLHLSA